MALAVATVTALGPLALCGELAIDMTSMGVGEQTIMDLQQLPGIRDNQWCARRGNFRRHVVSINSRVECSHLK